MTLGCTKTAERENKTVTMCHRSLNGGDLINGQEAEVKIETTADHSSFIQNLLFILHAVANSAIGCLIGEIGPPILDFMFPPIPLCESDDHWDYKLATTL